MANVNSTKVILSKNTRWSYANVWAPKSINGDPNNAKYSVSLIIKKDSPDVEKIKAAMKLAYTEGLSKLKGNGKTVPAFENIKLPLHDGDIEKADDPAYAGCYYLNANSQTAPGIVGPDCQPILDHSEVYSGVRGRASISFFAYCSAGNRGIGVNLNNLQKWFDDEPLGSKRSAEAEFSKLEDDDDFLA